MMFRILKMKAKQMRKKIQNKINRKTVMKNQCSKVISSKNKYLLNNYKR